VDPMSEQDRVEWTRSHPERRKDLQDIATWLDREKGIFAAAAAARNEPHALCLPDPHAHYGKGINSVSEPGTSRSRRTDTTGQSLNTQTRNAHNAAVPTPFFTCVFGARMPR
jgi:hypothetical protein